MSHQVNFYKHPDDVAQFDQVLRTRKGTCFIEARLPSPELKTVQGLAASQIRKSLLGYLARETDLDNVRFRRVPDDDWTVDQLTSPVVEYLGSFYDGTIIRRGRLYFQTGFYDGDDRWVDKPKEFVKWGDSLLRWIRSHYKRDPETGFYVGPHAQEWVSQGKGKLGP